MRVVDQPQPGILQLQPLLIAVAGELDDFAIDVEVHQPRQHLALANHVARGRRLDNPAGDRDIDHAGVMRFENRRRGDMAWQRHHNDYRNGRDGHRRQQPGPFPTDARGELRAG